MTIEAVPWNQPEPAAFYLDDGSPRPDVVTPPPTNYAAAAKDPPSSAEAETRLHTMIQEGPSEPLACAATTNDHNPIAVPLLRSYLDVLDELGEAPTFLLDGLIHESATLVWGASEQGKSSLLQSATKALALGETWHGHSVPAGPCAIAVFASDPGGVREWCERLDEIGAPPTVYVAEPPRPVPVLWRGVVPELAQKRVRLVIVDNFYSWAPGADVNKNGDVGPVLECLGGLQRAGMAVVLVHHSDKRATSPAGTHAFVAWFRHQVRVSRRTMVAQGNSAERVSYAVTWDGWQVADLLPLPAGSGPGLPGRNPSRPLKQSKAERAAIFLRSLPTPPGNVSEAGRLLAAEGISTSPDAGRKLAMRLRDEDGFPI